jgi:hypothetical protein
MRVTLLVLVFSPALLFTTPAGAANEPCYRNFDQCVRTYLKRGFSNAHRICSQPRIRYCR